MLEIQPLVTHFLSFDTKMEDRMITPAFESLCSSFFSNFCTNHCIFLCLSFSLSANTSLSHLLGKLKFTASTYHRKSLLRSSTQYDRWQMVAKKTIKSEYMLLGVRAFYDRKPTAILNTSSDLQKEGYMSFTIHSH